MISLEIIPFYRFFNFISKKRGVSTVMQNNEMNLSKKIGKNAIISPAPEYTREDAMCDYVNAVCCRKWND
jgi:hypothetical protein